MDKRKIEQLTEDLIKVANKYIDEDEMSTEDVCSCFLGSIILIVRASIPAEKSAIEENLN